MKCSWQFMVGRIARTWLFVNLGLTSWGRCGKGVVRCLRLAAQMQAIHTAGPGGQPLGEPSGRHRGRFVLRGELAGGENFPIHGE